MWTRWVGEGGRWLLVRIVKPLGAAYHPPFFARAVVALMDALELPRAHLIGNSMGGRVALHMAADEGVAAVVALAPWVENDVRQPRPGTPVLLMHGTRDRITDPRRTQVIARRFAEAGVAVRHIRVEGENHAMLHHAREWHEMVAHFLIGSLLGRRRAS